MLSIDMASAEKGHDILKKIVKGISFNPSELLEYYNSCGIQFLKSHLFNHGGYSLTFENFKRFHTNYKGSNIFENSIIKGMRVIDLGSDKWKLNLQHLESKIVARVNKYLIDDISMEHIKIYFIFGIRGTAITQDNEIAIDLCDSSLYINHKLSVERIEDVICHEVHHIGVNRQLEKIMKDVLYEQDKYKYLIIEGLLSEGMAYFYFTPWMKEEPYIKSIWESNWVNIEKTIEKLDKLLDEGLSKEGKINLENYLFGEELVGYTLGYHMVKTIHEVKGHEGISSSLNNFNLFHEYKKVGKI